MKRIINSTIPVVITILLTSICFFSYERFIVYRTVYDIGWKRWWKPTNKERNQLGFRGVYSKPSEYLGKKIVLLAGDSQVETSHPLELMPASLLESYLGSEYKVISLGSWGFGNIQHKLAIEEALKYARKNKLPVTNLVLWFTLNDYTDNLNRTGLNGLRSYYSIEDRRILNPSPRLKLQIKIEQTFKTIKKRLFRLLSFKTKNILPDTNISPSDYAIKSHLRKVLEGSPFHFHSTLSLLKKDISPKLFERDPMRDYSKAWFSLSKDVRKKYYKVGLDILSNNFLSTLKNYKNFSKNQKFTSRSIPFSSCGALNIPGFSSSVYPRVANKLLNDIKDVADSNGAATIILLTEGHCFTSDNNLELNGEIIYKKSEGLKTFDTTFKGLDIITPSIEWGYDSFDGFDGHLSHQLNKKVMKAVSDRIKDRIKIKAAPSLPIDF